MAVYRAAVNAAWYNNQRRRMLAMTAPYEPLIAWDDGDVMAWDDGDNISWDA